MRTSHLLIIGTLILAISGLGFLYLRDKQSLETFKKENNIEDITADGTLVTKMKKLEDNNEILRQKQIIAELNEEIAGLKQQLADAGVSQIRGGVATSYKPASPEEANELQRLRDENARLKTQNQLAVAEAGLIVSASAQQKAQDIAASEEVKKQRPIAKILELNKEHYLAVIDPIGQPNLTPVNEKKRKLWVRRDGAVILKLTVDGLDAESGKYITQIDSSHSPEDISNAKLGDEVVFAIEKEEVIEPGVLPIVTPEFIDAPSLPEEKPSNNKNVAAPALPEFNK